MVSLDGGSGGNMGTWKTKEDKLNRIPQFKIDDIALQHLDLIYLDVEGYEPNVIEGARNSILKFKPVIVCENGHNHISLLDFLNYKSVDQSYSDTFFVPVDLTYI